MKLSDRPFIAAVMEFYKDIEEAGELEPSGYEFMNKLSKDPAYLEWLNQDPDYQIWLDMVLYGVGIKNSNGERVDPVEWAKASDLFLKTVKDYEDSQDPEVQE